MSMLRRRNTGIAALLLAALLLPLLAVGVPVRAEAADKWVEEDHFPRVTVVSAEEMPMIEDISGAEISFISDRVRILNGVSLDLNTFVNASESVGRVAWSSADPGVVRVDENGVITGHSIGSAWITARLGHAQARIYVYVDANSMLPANDEKTYFLRVNKSQNCITVFERDEEGEYTVPIRAFRCSTGANTPNKMQKIRNHNAWNGLYGDYEGMWSSWIISFFLFHSVPYYHRTHNSLNERMYNEFGTTCSGGCVRLQCLNAKWIYDNCPVGTAVEFYYDEEVAGPLGLPEAIRLPTGLKWDPTDPYEENPWLFGGEPEIKGVKDFSVRLGASDVNYFGGVRGVDTVGNDISDRVRVLTALDTSVAGDYLVIYSLTDASYKTAYAYCTVHVG